MVYLGEIGNCYAFVRDISGEENEELDEEFDEILDDLE
jgi:hypothetical protein